MLRRRRKRERSGERKVGTWWEAFARMRSRRRRRCREQWRRRRRRWRQGAVWRVRRPAGGPVTGTGSLRGSSFRLPCKRTTASSRLDSPPSPSQPLLASLSLPLKPFPGSSFASLAESRLPCSPLAIAASLSLPSPLASLRHHPSLRLLLSHESVATRAKHLSPPLSLVLPSSSSDSLLFFTLPSVLHPTV